MKATFQKISATFLTLLVLFSTVSFTVGKHYCGSFLVDVALFSEAKGCGMESIGLAKNDNHDFCNNSEVKRKPCCKDEKITIEGQDELRIALDQLETPQQSVATFFLHSGAFIFSDMEKEEIYFKEYDPPNLVRDYQVFYETFLI